MTGKVLSLFAVARLPHEVPKWRDLEMNLASKQSVNLLLAVTDTASKEANRFECINLPDALRLMLFGRKKIGLKH